MITYPTPTLEVVDLIRQLYGDLEKASRGKLSTDDKTPERLLWEIFNKIFSILCSCENSLLCKDSLSIHLLGRYAYELLCIFAYIFLDKAAVQERAARFIKFNQFMTAQRKWDEKTLTQMLEALPNNQRFSGHKNIYRKLSNFAHPTMDSFLLNRRGERKEFLQCMNTALFTVSVMLEIIKICFEENLHFTTEERELINVPNIQKAMQEIFDIIGRELKVA